jgi:hypothetical protein
MEWSKIYSTIIVGLLITLWIFRGASWHDTYKIKDNLQTSPGEWKFYYLLSNIVVAQTNASIQTMSRGLGG